MKKIENAKLPPAFPALFPLVILFILCLVLFSSCIFLGNQFYVDQHSMYRGTRRVTVFLQPWPSYRRLPNQMHLWEDFIKKTTTFFGPWELTDNYQPRAIDIDDIDDNMMGEVIKKILQEKGYTPFLGAIAPLPARPVNVKEIMALSQAVNPNTDAFLFCYYAPMVYLANSEEARGLNRQKSHSIQEVIEFLRPGRDKVIWAGPRAADAPPRSISHAFIYISMTCFQAYSWRPLWEVSGSATGGTFMLDVAQCPPGPTDKNYFADAEIIQRLMINNLACRLRHLIPYAF